MMDTFTDFKNDFYSRIKDLSLFDCGDINLLKVVLDGLRVKYKSDQPIKSDFLLPGFAYEAKYILKSIKYNIKRNHRTYIRKEDKGKILIGFSERAYSIDGKNKSVYFERLFNLMGRDNVVFVGESKKEELGDEADYRLQVLINNYSVMPANKEDRSLRHELKNTFDRIARSGIFSPSEQSGIASAFEVFLIHFKAWNLILKELKPPVVIFDQHYHREGFILACQLNHVKTIELQHGLIVPEDMFYVFPGAAKDIIHKALFADHIFVYGEYWKRNLLKGVEYNANQIHTIGFYHYEEETNNSHEELVEFAGECDIILITTQVNMSATYCRYIKMLSQLLYKKNYPWKIIVKIHPSEEVADYSEVSDLLNCKIVKLPLSDLFKMAKIHISVYSTTLFDAHRFIIHNFTLYDEKHEDYCKRIENDGIAKPLTIFDDPVQLYMNSANATNDRSNYLYETFDQDKFLKALNK